MSSVMYRPSLRRRLGYWMRDFDLPLFIALMLVMALGSLMVMSASNLEMDRLVVQLRNVGLSLGIMLVLAQVPPHQLMRLAVPVYTVGLTLLVAVMVMGLVRKGARRWLDLHVVVLQPSELFKIGMPLLLAWYFQKREGAITVGTFLVASVLLLVPVALIVKQPDLGTGGLVLMAGFSVIFFAGLSWKVLVGLAALGAMAVPLWWHFLAHGFQRDRILMLIDPHADPLGRGFHIIQSLIAVGSGGIFGKGYLQGTQSHLDFIPEVSTDFIFAITAEEFGIMGAVVLMGLYAFIIARTFAIASNAPTMFSRLLASAIAMTLFTYVFINMGMVMGLLPVVGVPLPFMSYGGTAYVSLGIAYGTVLSIAKHKRLMIS